MCAYWKPLKWETKPVIASLGDGINTGVPPFDAKDSEATYLRDLDSREYPALTVRPGRSTYTTVLSTAVTSLGQRNNSVLHVVNGNTWEYWNAATTAWVVLTTTLASTEAEIAEFIVGTNRYTILMNSTQKYIWDGTSTILALGDSTTPNTKIFTVHHGRIFAARNNDFMYNAINLSTDWSSANQAGSVDVTRAKGPITGICEYGDKIITFTEHSMHELYGTGPNTYELVDVEGTVGCVSHRSIAKVGSRLYWLALDGVYEYDGSAPVKVSMPVDDYIKDIPYAYRAKVVSGGIGDLLYLSIPYGSTATQNNLILKFDTRLRKWYPEEGAFTDFEVVGATLYGIDTAGQTWNMRDTSTSIVADGATPIPWSFITKPFTEGVIQGKKTVSDLYLLVNMTTNSTALSVGYSTAAYGNDASTFTTLTTITNSSNVQNQRVQVPLTSLQDVNFYRLRLSGSGPVTIHGLQKNVRVMPR